MTKKMSVDDLYGGRHRPFGQVRDGSHRRIESEPSFETGNTRGTAFNKPDVQDPEDKHDRKLCRRCRRRLAARRRQGRRNGQAFIRPGQCWRKGRAGSLDWGSGHDPATVRKPEPNKP